MYATDANTRPIPAIAIPAPRPAPPPAVRLDVLVPLVDVAEVKIDCESIDEPTSEGVAEVVASTKVEVLR